MACVHSQPRVEIPLKEGGSFSIYAEADIESDTLLKLPVDEAERNGEESVQLLEGSSYEYELPPGYILSQPSRSIVRPSRVHPYHGRITPGIYVGRLALTIEHDEYAPVEIAVEVRSVKAEYRSEYRKMLEDITAECTELLMIHSSPVTQRFTVDYDCDPRTLYQRFSFVKSIVDSDEFRNAVHRVISMPVTHWTHQTEEHDIRRARRITPAQLRQMASRSDRIKLPEKHPLRGRIGMRSVPSRLTAETRTDTVDTPENRFVKHALSVFRLFCGMVIRAIEKNTDRPHIYTEAKLLEEQFGAYLNYAVFQEVSDPTSLPLNSPILQRKEGYREILRVWFMFDLAARLTWDAMDEDQYHAGKRDAATLYEYWLFFKLLHLIQDIFSIDPKETKELIQETADGLGLQLKAGKHIAVEGEHLYRNRRLRVEFSYNRTFGKADYPESGSWTRQMRPDYTLSLWPADFTQREAERQELIVHIHFDAKYRVEGLKYLTSEEDEFDLSREKQEQKEGTYKRADLLKMHAYKDAIRRTGGAYILYPGTKSYRQRGFHEIVPGLGAFPVSPSNQGDGMEQIRTFILEIVDHFSDRASRREELSFHTYEINQNSRERGSVHELMPEQHYGYRVHPPRETTVLIGYYNNDQYAWIKNNRLYNIRIDKSGGLKRYGPAETGARYLLLHGKDGLVSGDLWQISGENPVLMSKDELIRRKYPGKPSREYYLVYTISPVSDSDFAGQKWDIRKLKGYSGGRGSARPFAVTLQELMTVKENNQTAGISYE